MVEVYQDQTLHSNFLIVTAYQMEAMELQNLNNYCKERWEEIIENS